MTKQQNITFVVPVAKKHAEYMPELVRVILASEYQCNIQIDEKKIGKSRMLNRMIQNVNTKWIRFLDADDMPIFTYHEEDYDFNKYDLIYTDCFEQFADGVDDYVSAAGELNLEQENHIPFSTIIVRTSLAKQVKWDAGPLNGIGDDWIWLSNFCKLSMNFLYIPDVSCIRRNYTSTYNWRFLKWKLRKVRKYIANTKEMA